MKRLIFTCALLFASFANAQEAASDSDASQLAITNPEIEVLPALQESGAALQAAQLNDGKNVEDELEESQPSKKATKVPYFVKEPGKSYLLESAGGVAGAAIGAGIGLGIALAFLNSDLWEPGGWESSKDESVLGVAIGNTFAAILEALFIIVIVPTAATTFGSAGGISIASHSVGKEARVLPTFGGTLLGGLAGAITGGLTYGALEDSSQTLATVAAITLFLTLEVSGGILMNELGQPDWIPPTSAAMPRFEPWKNHGPELPKVHSFPLVSFSF